MKQLGEGFGQAIGQGFHENRIVDLMPGVEAGTQLVAADAGRDGKGADVVGPAAVQRGDVVGQGAGSLLALAFPLLA